MKPIKIVQRETKLIVETQFIVERDNDNYVVMSDLVAPKEVRGEHCIRFTKPTARRLAAALLKIAGKK